MYPADILTYAYGAPSSPSTFTIPKGSQLHIMKRDPLGVVTSPYWNIGSPSFLQGPGLGGLACAPVEEMVYPEESSFSPALEPTTNVGLGEVLGVGLWFGNVLILGNCCTGDGGREWAWRWEQLG